MRKVRQAGGRSDDGRQEARGALGWFECSYTSITSTIRLLQSATEHLKHGRPEGEQPAAHVRR